MNIVKALEASRTDSNDKPMQEVLITRTSVVPVQERIMISKRS